MPDFINIILVVIKLICVGRRDKATDEIFLLIFAGKQEISVFSV